MTNARPAGSETGAEPGSRAHGSASDGQNDSARTLYTGAVA